MLRRIYTHVFTPAASTVSYAAGFILTPLTSPVSGSLTMDEAWKMVSTGDVEFIIDDMIEQAKITPSGVSTRYFGKKIGHVTVVAPTLAANSTVFIKNLLHKLDYQEGSRKFFQFSNDISQADTLPTMTGKKAVPYRHLLHQYLIRNKQEQNFSDATTKIMHDRLIATFDKPIDLDKFILLSVRGILTKTILGVNDLTEKAITALDYSQAYIQEFSKFSLFNNKASAMLKEAQLAYSQWVNEMIENDFDAILYAVEQGNSTQNSFAAVVISILKDQEPYTESQGGLKKQVRDILKNDALIRAIPATLFPGESVAPLISECLLKLKCLFSQAKVPSKDIFLMGLEDEIAKLSSGEIWLGDLLDKNKTPYIDALYMEALRTFDLSVDKVVRVSNAEIKSGDVTIPANATVIVSLNSRNKDEKLWKDPNEFNPARFLMGPDSKSSEYKNIELGKTLSMPFSTGYRMCPANKTTEEIFKTALVTFLKEVDIAKSTFGQTVKLVKKDSTPALTAASATPAPKKPS
jgi:hypothetical protein